jgi:hypothetical protein
LFAVETQATHAAILGGATPTGAGAYWLVVQCVSYSFVLVRLYVLNMSNLHENIFLFSFRLYRGTRDGSNGILGTCGMNNGAFACNLAFNVQVQQLDDGTLRVFVCVKFVCCNGDCFHFVV